MAIIIIIIIIIILGIVHRPVLYLKQQLGDWILSSSSGGTYWVGVNRYRAQLNTFHLKTDTESYLRNIMF
jgi:hypothetical protein